MKTMKTLANVMYRRGNAFISSNKAWILEGADIKSISIEENEILLDENTRVHKINGKQFLTINEERYLLPYGSKLAIQFAISIQSAIWIIATIHNDGAKKNVFMKLWKEHT